jgi:hypothetical protein
LDEIFSASIIVIDFIPFSSDENGLSNPKTNELRFTFSALGIREAVLNKLSIQLPAEIEEKLQNAASAKIKIFVFISVVF